MPSPGPPQLPANDLAAQLRSAGTRQEPSAASPWWWLPPGRAQGESNSPSRFCRILSITVAVFYRRERHPLSPPTGTNVTGDRLLDRVRNISFALLGSVAAIALGLVAIVANVGWPNLVDSPIPALPRENVAANRALARAPAPAREASGQGRPRVAAGPVAVSARQFFARRPPPRPGRPNASGLEAPLRPSPTSAGNAGRSKPGKAGGSKPATEPVDTHPSPTSAPAAPTAQTPASQAPTPSSPQFAATTTSHPGARQWRDQGPSPGNGSPWRGGGDGHAPPAAWGSDQAPGQPASGPCHQEAPAHGDSGPGFGHGHGFGHFGR